MSNTQSEVERLMREASNTENLYKLWDIAEKLNKLGAWDAAVVVIHKIRKIEQTAAAEVMA
jgi:hypothetical protein